jgi:Lipoprotein LpqB beta-propeller domain/Sporulation and spore germination
VARLGRGGARAACVRHACLAAAVAVSVAGCIGMAQTGQVGTFGNKQADTGQNPGSDVGLFPSGPQPGASPADIVREFLVASARYPTDVPIIQEYLAGPAKNWNPGWSVTVLKNNYAVNNVGVLPAGAHNHGQALVEVSGPVQAAFNSSGQYVSASAEGGKTTETYRFSLVKVGSQWRISNPPSTYRLISAYDFPHDYQAQDLYFFASSGPQSQGQVLVPDSVFVPKGTSLTLLLRNLVSALAQGPGPTWLQGAASSGFPAGTKILDAVQDGATVTVNLGGAAAAADTHTLEQISAQLLWTLAGPTASVQTVQSVELELNGRPWTPPSAPPPCPTGQVPTAYQGLASYECYDPYPSAPASFSYVGAGQPWSRCGSESVAQGDAVGSIVSVFGRTGSADSHQCGGYVDPHFDAPFPRALPTAALSLVAVSPDGDYVAGVSPAPARNTLYVGPVSGTATSFSASQRLKEPGITAISWDRDDDLWAAQGVTIWVVPGSGTSRYQAQNAFGGQVTSLAVAPDGVRVAAIVQTGAGSELELASINRGVAQQEGVQKGSLALQFTMGQPIQLGPNLTDPIAVTWYNADYLIVIDADATGNVLWLVPVDGEQASQLPVSPTGAEAVSITADGAGNILVAGLSDNHLAFAYGTAGPWTDLGGGGGSSPAYP